MSNGINDSAVKSQSAKQVAVHSLDHFAFEVPNLSEAVKFYTDFGLEVREESGALGLYARDSAHRWAIISEGPVKRLRYVCFGAYQDDMAELGARLDREGVERCAPASANAEGHWFLNPDGVPIQIIAAEKSSPDKKTEFRATSAPEGKAGAVRKALAPPIRPRRLAHIGIFTRDVMNSVEFYERTLGTRLSDRSEGIIAFVHAPHGSDHHLFAIIHSSKGSGLHHSSWDVPSFDDVGLGAQRMIENGYPAGWGLGRHLLGSNYFYYVQDPWKSYAEYTADIDYIPAGFEWKAANHSPDDTFSLWGPPSPPEFGHNFEQGPE